MGFNAGKRAYLAVAAALAAFVSAAQAETMVFRDVLRPHGAERGSAERLADGRACGMAADRTIANLAPFQKCMKARGWVADHMQVDPSDPSGIGYVDMRPQPNGTPRSDAEREAAYNACNPGGRRDPRSASMKACMLAKGWQFSYDKPSAVAPSSTASNSSGGETIWNDTTGRRRNDALLRADSESCQASLGPGAVLRPPGSELQSCMRARGWRFLRASGPSYWKDPDHDGMMCHDILGGLGESCSNF